MAVIRKAKPPSGIILISIIAFITYLLSLAKIVPEIIGGIRLDLLLYFYLVLATGTLLLVNKEKTRTINEKS